MSIAILTSDRRKPFAGNHQNFADLIEMGRKLGIHVFVLTPAGISPDQSSVQGYLLQSAKPMPTFRAARLPWPKAIYNRVPNRNDEQSTSVTRAMELCRQRNIPIFNPRFFDKWSLFRRLADSNCRTYLPTTTKWGDFETFHSWKKQFSALILKPINGKAGIGMMKISGNGPFVLQYQTKQQKQRLVLPTLTEAYQQINKRTNNRSYILQQAINLATYQGNPFDIRMLVQKDGTAKWKISGIGVRVAGKKAISTHVPMGGRIASFPAVLSSTFPQQKSKIHKQLIKLGLFVAKQIESQYKGHYGEMSMDIGLDHQGRPWFFEANAKPQKFDEPAIRARSLRRVLEYARYLGDKR